MARLRVGIFAGGRSAEHEVSVSSADAVLRAIDRDRFEPYLVYIDRDGRWHLPAGPAAAARRRAPGRAARSQPRPPSRRACSRSLADTAAPRSRRRPRRPRAAQRSLRSLAEAIDVAFLALHGPFGEDGTLQGFLEMAGIPYTGAGVMASAVAMDKVVFKDLMRGHGLPVVDYAWFRRAAWRASRSACCATSPRRSASGRVVKPARLGSSVGMTLVHGPRELPAASTRRSATTPR